MLKTVEPRSVLLLVSIWLGVPPLAHPQTTEEVFERFSDRVVKIEVQETGSAAKAASHSGTPRELLQNWPTKTK